MTSKAVRGIRITTDKKGRQRITAKPAFSSVSTKIRHSKSKRTRVVKRAP